MSGSQNTILDDDVDILPADHRYLLVDYFPWEFQEPDANTVELENGERIQINLYLHNNAPSENLRFKFIMDLLKESILWQAEQFQEALPWNDIKLIAGYDMDMSNPIGCDYPEIIVPIEYLQADPASHTYAELETIIDHILKMIFRRDAKTLKDEDFWGCLKQYLFMKHKFGPVFEISYANKFRNSVDSNKISLEQKYVSLALSTVAYLGGIDAFLSYMQWHKQTRPGDHKFSSIVASFNEVFVHQFEYELTLLTKFDPNRTIPKYIPTIIAEGDRYEAKFRQLIQGKLKVASEANPAVMEFAVFDKNNVRMFPEIAVLIQDDPVHTIYTKPAVSCDQPILLLRVKNLLAMVHEDTFVMDNAKRIAFQDPDPVTKFLTWKSILKVMIRSIIRQIAKESPVIIPQELFMLYEQIIDAPMNLGVKAELLKLPVTLPELHRQFIVYPSHQVTKAFESLQKGIAMRFKDKFKDLSTRYSASPQKYLVFSKEVIARKNLENVCTRMLLLTDDLDTKFKRDDLLSNPNSKLINGCYYVDKETKSLANESKEIESQAITSLSCSLSQVSLEPVLFSNAPPRNIAALPAVMANKRTRFISS